MKKHGIIFLLIALVLAFSGCSKDEQRQQCLEDLKAALQTRWDIVDTEYSTYEDSENGTLQGINAELQILLPYKDIQFKNESFGEIIKTYIRAVESQRDGTVFVFSDVDKYNELFYNQGLKIRSQCLSELKSKYDFTVDDGYKEALESVISFEYNPLIAPKQKVRLETNYGTLGVSFTKFETLVNPAGEKELVLYCEIENISYYDGQNPNCIFTDHFMGVYDGANYNIETKGSAYGYIPGYKECVSGIVELRQGEKGKFALIYDYVNNIDIIYIWCSGNNGSYACYLTSEEWDGSGAFQNTITTSLTTPSVNTISAGHRHTVGLKVDGTVLVVGDRGDGQCNVSDWRNIVSLTAGIYYTVGLKEDGTVITAGGNYYGQCNVSDWTDITAISAGFGHTVGLKSDGSVVATGWNEHNQCDVSQWKDIVAIAAGHKHTVGLKANGTVVASGDNSYGRCDVGGWNDITAIAVGIRHTVGLKSDGTVIAIGSNDSGQCDVSDWKNIVAVSAGEDFTVGLREDGTVVATGYNPEGQCNVSGWTDVVSIAAGESHTVGLMADGRVVAVGLNDYGQCDVSGWSNIALR